MEAKQNSLANWTNHIQTKQCHQRSVIAPSGEMSFLYSKRAHPQLWGGFICKTYKVLLKPQVYKLELLILLWRKKLDLGPSPIFPLFLVGAVDFSKMTIKSLMK